MLQNAYLVAKIGADAAENEQDFSEILPTFCLLVVEADNCNFTISAVAFRLRKEKTFSLQGKYEGG